MLDLSTQHMQLDRSVVSSALDFGLEGWGLNPTQGFLHVQNLSKETVPSRWVEPLK